MTTRPRPRFRVAMPEPMGCERVLVAMKSMIEELATHLTMQVLRVPFLYLFLASRFLITFVPQVLRVLKLRIWSCSALGTGIAVCQIKYHHREGAIKLPPGPWRPQQTSTELASGPLLQVHVYSVAATYTGARTRCIGCMRVHTRVHVYSCCNSCYWYWYRYGHIGIDNFAIILQTIPVPVLGPCTRVPSCVYVPVPVHVQHVYSHIVGIAIYIVPVLGSQLVPHVHV